MSIEFTFSLYPKITEFTFGFDSSGLIPAVWILAAGTWNDSGVWDDSEIWNDN